MDGDRPPPSRRAQRSAPEDVRPWTPWQIAATSFLFGAGACGAAAGLNFVRLGKRQYLVPSVLAGLVVFVAAAALAMFLVPDEAVRLAGLLVNSAAGFGFALVQKPFFEGWRAANWRPKLGDRYKPNGLGQLVLVSLAGLAIEIVVVGLFATLYAIR
jgi:hypothetical protein